MILVDTSVWVDHLRHVDRELAAQLEEGFVLVHPLVMEELACGHLPHRDEILGLLATLPQPPTASHDEVLAFIASARLQGTGLGAADVHLLASARLAHATLWSRDRALRLAAQKLDILEPKA